MMKTTILIMTNNNETQVLCNPTLKTLNRIRDAIKQYPGAFSIAALYNSLNINFYSVRACVNELSQNGYIKEIQSTGKGRLFLKNE